MQTRLGQLENDIAKLEMERRESQPGHDEEYARQIAELEDVMLDLLLDDSAPLTVVQATALRNNVRSMRNKIGILEAQARTLVNGSSVKIEDGDLPACESRTKFNSVCEAVEEADNTLERLRFLRSAFESARRSQFSRPNEVYYALETLDACGKARIEGTLSGDIAEWMAGRGVEFAAHESEKTVEQHADERTFYDRELDQSIYMPAHIKIGGSQLRIHVLWETAANEWLIGWVGDHLPTAGHNS